MNALSHPSARLARYLIVAGYLSLQALAFGEREPLAIAIEGEVGIPKEHWLFPEQLEREILGEREFIVPEREAEPSPRPKLFDVDLELAGQGELLIRVTALQDIRPILWISDDLKTWTPVLSMGQSDGESVYLFLVQSGLHQKRFYKVSPVQALVGEVKQVKKREAADENDEVVLQREVVKEASPKGDRLEESTVLELAE